MATHVIFHEVDDVEHWLSSPKREEVFGPMGITVRTFRDPQGSNRVGLIVEIPDMAAFQSFMQTGQAAEAMKHLRAAPRDASDSRRGIALDPTPDVAASHRPVEIRQIVIKILGSGMRAVRETQSPRTRRSRRFGVAEFS